MIDDMTVRNLSLATQLGALRPESMAPAASHPPRCPAIWDIVAQPRVHLVATGGGWAVDAPANAAQVVMTTWRIEAMLRRLDRTIKATEARCYHLDSTDLRAVIALKKLRTDLRLLLVARRLECKKHIVSLDRWRHGFHGRRIRQERWARTGTRRQNNAISASP